MKHHFGQYDFAMLKKYTNGNIFASHPDDYPCEPEHIRQWVCNFLDQQNLPHELTDPTNIPEFHLKIQHEQAPVKQYDLPHVMGVVQSLLNIESSVVNYGKHYFIDACSDKLSYLHTCCSHSALGTLAKGMDA